MGDKSSYTAKQKRQAAHIEESEERRGRSGKTAERIAWATVNKQDGGGKGKKAVKGRGKRASQSTRPSTRSPPGPRSGRRSSSRTTRARA